MICRNDSPASAMALSSLGSLGLRCNFRLDMDEDLPKLKNERQLPTGDFLDLIGGLFLKTKMEGGEKNGQRTSEFWGREANSQRLCTTLGSILYSY